MFYLVTQSFNLLGVQETRAQADALRPSLEQALHDADITQEPVKLAVLSYQGLVSKLKALKGTQATVSGERYLAQLLESVNRIEEANTPLAWSMDAYERERQHLESLQEDDLTIDDKPIAFTVDGFSITNPYRSADYSCEVNPLNAYHKHYIQWFNSHFAAVSEAN